MDCDLNSDEEDTRPYKCVECGKGFRISGHLARHMKSDLHLKRMQELRELGIESHASQSRATGLNASEPIYQGGSLSPTAGLIADDMARGVNGSDPDSQSRRFRCNTCNTGFRFQGHLDRHLRSTAHHAMLEGVGDGQQIGSQQINDGQPPFVSSILNITDH